MIMDTTHNLDPLQIGATDSLEAAWDWISSDHVYIDLEK